MSGTASPGLKLIVIANGQSASILLYLSKTYDTKHAFNFADDDKDTDMLNWIMFMCVFACLVVLPSSSSSSSSRCALAQSRRCWTYARYQLAEV